MATIKRASILILSVFLTLLTAADFCQDSIIIQLKEDPSFSFASSIASKRTTEPQLPDSIKNLNNAYQIKEVKFLGNTETLNQRTAKMTASKTYLEARDNAEKITALEEKNGLNRFFKLTFATDVDIPFLLAQYKNDPNIAVAEPNYIYRAMTTIPDDIYFNNQNNYLPQIDAQTGWDITTGSSSVVVAVLDTGINYNHEDLATNMWSGKLHHGHDIVNNDDDPMDDFGHGTMVAGCLGAKGNNNKGIAGVAWNVQLMAIKVLDNEGHGSAESVAEGIRYAYNNGAQIINMSLGGSNAHSTILESACKTAYESGCLLVAASGNEGKSTVDYPAAYNTVIAVGATNPDNTRAYFSNYEYGILELSAPGVNIYTTQQINNAYGSASGTSFASPIVAGTAALLKAHNSGLTNIQIRTILKNTAVDIGSPGYDAATGYGLVNIYNSLTGVIPPRQSFQHNSIYDVYNFPNPVKSNETRFSFKSEERIDAIEIYIYDLKGREKVRIEASFTNPLPGTYTTGEWDCRDAAGRKLANGTYLYVIKSESFKTPVKGKLTLLN